MARRRYDHMDKAHDALMAWASWMDRHVARSRIGYPSRSVEARLTESAGPTAPASSAPNVMMPDWCSRVDHAVRDMPVELRLVVACEYLEDKPRRIEVFRQETGRGRRDFYRVLDLALSWVGARIYH